MEPSKQMCWCLATFFLQLYKCIVGWNVLTDSRPRPTKKTTTMQFHLIQADQPLSNPPICVIPLSVPDLRHAFSLHSLVISDVFTTLVLVLLPVILCSQTGLRHAVCGPPGTPRGSDLVPLSLQWQFSPSLLPHKKKKDQAWQQLRPAKRTALRVSCETKIANASFNMTSASVMKTDMSTYGRGDLFQMPHVIRVLCHPPNNMSGA